jgi:hypothetical protein
MQDITQTWFDSLSDYKSFFYFVIVLNYDIVTVLTNLFVYDKQASGKKCYYLDGKTGYFTESDTTSCDKTYQPATNLNQVYYACRKNLACGIKKPFSCRNT